MPSTQHPSPPDPVSDGSRRRVQLLAADPELAQGLEPRELARATRVLPAPVVDLPCGAWAPETAPPPAGHLGYLVVEGFLIRRVQVHAGRSAELLGPGDLLRPWQEDASSFCEASWEVLEPASVALIEPPLTRQLSHWPGLLANLVGRSLRRARWLAADTAVADNVGVEERLLMLFWRLAEIWGSRDCGKTCLDLDLPHRVLGELIGARRPTVSTAMSALVAKGKIRSTGKGAWELLSDPPC